MSLLISDQKPDILLETRTVGITIDNDDIILAFKRANQYFNENYQLPTAERVIDLPLYSGIHEYPLPSDFRVIMRPTKENKEYFSNFQMTTRYDLKNFLKGMAFKFLREKQFLLVKSNSGDKKILHNCDSVTDDGTWAISGDGGSLVADDNIFIEGDGALRFVVTATGGTTTLTLTGMDAVDITDFLTDELFLNLQCPAGNTVDLTSIRIRIGSSASAYYEATATTRFRGDNLSPGWGAVGFDLSGKTTTGSPTDTSITYIQVLITHGTTGVTGTYRLDDIFIASPTYYQLPYYSNTTVKTITNTYIQHPTALTDTVLCPSVADGAVYYKALELLAIHDLQNAALAAYAARELAPKEQEVKAIYPSHRPTLQTFYYRTK